MPGGIVGEPPDPTTGTRLEPETGLSGKRERIHIHYIGTHEQLVAVQFESSLATMFHQPIGGCRGQFTAMEAPVPCRPMLAPPPPSRHPSGAYGRSAGQP
jgi:hypothetical protein